VHLVGFHYKTISDLFYPANSSVKSETTTFTAPFVFTLSVSVVKIDV